MTHMKSRLWVAGTVSVVMILVGGIRDGMGVSRRYVSLSGVVTQWTLTFLGCRISF